jgi:hypothetical protein
MSSKECSLVAAHYQKHLKYRLKRRRHSFLENLRCFGYDKEV